MNQQSPLNDLPKISRILDSFPYFLENIFWQSYENIKPTPHLIQWAKYFQDNKRVALLSARLHLKSTLVYAYLMWKFFVNADKDQDVLYISLSDSLAREHVRNIKKIIEKNPYFKEFKDSSTAEGEIRGSWNGKNEHRLTCTGMDSLKRGKHKDLVICDDILADPTQKIAPVKIEKANRIFFEEIMSIPLIDGEIKVVGTAQHEEDLFFQLRPTKDKPTGFHWSINPAIISEIDKKVLWQQNFSYEYLVDLRDNIIGERAFKKEYLCSPVHSESSYILRANLAEVMQLPHALPGIDSWEREVIAGFDIGKVVHPSHFVIYVKEGDLWVQIFQQFFDHWDYTKQIEEIKRLCDPYKIRKIYYDATRGEIEAFLENKVIDRTTWRPVNFNKESKFQMATNFARLVDIKQIKLIKDERQRRSILAVDDQLESVSNQEGHGDAFWSNAMALSHKTSRPLLLTGLNKIE